MGPTHRLFGAFAGAGTAAYTGQPTSVVVMAALIGTSTAHGWSSPDMDQTRPWVATLGRLPGRVGSHRFLSHWWGWPLLAWWLLEPQLSPEAVWPFTALLAGWVSHLVGDSVFGRLYLLPWGGPRFGVGLRTDGFVESGEWNGRRLLPWSPARLAITVGLGWLLWGAWT